MRSIVALAAILARLAEHDLDVLALAHILDTGDAERRKGVLNGLALRVEDAVLERDADAGFHADPQRVASCE